MPRVQTFQVSSLNRAAKLPSPRGRVVSVPLEDLPAYFGIHNIKPDANYTYAKPGTFEDNQILIVKRNSNE